MFCALSTTSLVAGELFFISSMSQMPCSISSRDTAGGAAIAMGDLCACVQHYNAHRASAKFLFPIPVHNAKAEECTTPYMRQNIEINIGVGGLHGNQGY